MSRPTSTMVCGKLCMAPEGDYFAVCSFDKNHIVLRSRLPYHIVKCIKQHPGHNKIQCPYDATEYIDPVDYPDHILQCESKTSFRIDEKLEIARLKETGNLCNTEYDPPPFHHKSAPVATEDWGGAKEPEVMASEELLMREDDEVVDDDFLVAGVGRGTKLRGEKDQSKVGKGRAAVLARIMKQYEERNAKGRLGSCSLSERSFGSSSSPGQFDDC